MKISQPMREALQQIEREADRQTGVVQSLIGPTPGTLRAMERRGLIRCSTFYAAEEVSLTDAGRAALSQ